MRYATTIKTRPAQSDDWTKLAENDKRVHERAAGGMSRNIEADRVVQFEDADGEAVEFASDLLGEIGVPSFALGESTLYVIGGTTATP